MDLHQQETVHLHEALHRVVQYDENIRIGGFIAHQDNTTHAYRLPIWVGYRMPVPETEFLREGVSLFEAPGRVDMFIGLVVVEE